jgi:hypothetical protein
VLHDWDEPVVKRLLAKSFAALPTGGMVVVHGAHLNAAKDGPLPVAAYSALLMNISEGKCYSETEIGGYLREVGFGAPTRRETAADRSIIFARK